METVEKPLLQSALGLVLKCKSEHGIHVETKALQTIYL